MYTPFFVRHIRLFTNNKPLKWWNHLIFMPAIAYSVFMLVLYNIIGYESSEAFLSDNATYASLCAQCDDIAVRILYLSNIYLFNILITSETVYAIIYIIIRVKKYRTILENYYSNLDSFIYLPSWRMVKLAFIILVLIDVCIYFIPPSLIGKTNVFYSIYYGLYTVSLNIACSFMYIQKQVPLCEYEEQGTNSGNDSANNSSWQTHQEELMQKLDELITQERVFLRSDIQLDTLASMLMTNRSYASHVINEVYHQNFSDFINSHRIEYAKQLILEFPTLTQDNIAKSSGFTSKSTFLRTFAKFSGCSLTSWTKQQKETTAAAESED